MATKQITVRIDEELEKQILNRIKAIKNNSRGGVEINLSSVIRYSLEQYLNEQNELDRGVINIKFELDKMDEENLKKSKFIGDQMISNFCDGYEEIINLGIDGFNLSFSADQRLFKLEQKNKLNISNSDKELLEKYKKED